MFCTKCGKQLEEGSRFCPYCGTAQGQKGSIPERHSVDGSGRSVQFASGNVGKEIENFLIKFMTADWANKIYFILAVIYSARMVVFLIPQMFLFPASIDWMKAVGLVSACLVYYGIAALIVRTAIYWLSSICTMELGADKKPKMYSVVLGGIMFFIKLSSFGMYRRISNPIMLGIYFGTRRYLPVAVFILVIVTVCGIIRLVKMQKHTTL